MGAIHCSRILRFLFTLAFLIAFAFLSMNTAFSLIVLEPQEEKQTPSTVTLNLESPDLPPLSSSVVQNKLFQVFLKCSSECSGLPDCLGVTIYKLHVDADQVKLDPMNSFVCVPTLNKEEKSHLGSLFYKIMFRDKLPKVQRKHFLVKNFLKMNDMQEKRSEPIRYPNLEQRRRKREESPHVESPDATVSPKIQSVKIDPLFTETSTVTTETEEPKHFTVKFSDPASLFGENKAPSTSATEVSKGEAIVSSITTQATTTTDGGDLSSLFSNAPPSSNPKEKDTNVESSEISTVSSNIPAVKIDPLFIETTTISPSDATVKPSDISPVSVNSLFETSTSSPIGIHEKEPSSESSHTTVNEAVSESTPTTIHEAATESSSTTVHEAATENSSPTVHEEATESSSPAVHETATESSPTTAHEPVSESSPTTAHEPVSESTPTTVHEAVFESTPATVYEAVSESSPTTVHEAVTESSPTTTHEPVSESSPTTAHEPVSESTPTTVHEAVSESTPTTVHEAVSESSPTTVHEAVSESTPTTVHEAVSESSPTTVHEAVTESSPTTAHEPVSESTPTTVHEAVSESSPTTVHEAVSESSPTTVHEAVSESSPTTVHEAVSESSPTTVHEAVSESSPTTVHEAVSESSPTTVHEAVSESSPTTVHEAVSESSPTTVHEAVSESSPTTVHEPVSESTPTTIHEAVSESTPTTVHEAVSESSPTTLHEAVSVSSPTAVHEAITESSPTTVHEAVSESNPISATEVVSESTPSTVTKLVSENHQGNLTEAILKDSQTNVTTLSFGSTQNSLNSSNPSMISHSSVNNSVTPTVTLRVSNVTGVGAHDSSNISLTLVTEGHTNASQVDAKIHSSNSESTSEKELTTTETNPGTSISAESLSHDIQTLPAGENLVTDIPNINLGGPKNITEEQSLFEEIETTTLLEPLESHIADSNANTTENILKSAAVSDVQPNVSPVSINGTTGKPKSNHKVSISVDIDFTISKKFPKRKSNKNTKKNNASKLKFPIEINVSTLSTSQNEELTSTEIASITETPEVIPEMEITSAPNDNGLFTGETTTDNIPYSFFEYSTLPSKIINGNVETPLDMTNSDDINSSYEISSDATNSPVEITTLSEGSIEEPDVTTLSHLFESQATDSECLFQDSERYLRNIKGTAFSMFHGQPTLLSFVSGVQSHCVGTLMKNGTKGMRHIESIFPDFPSDIEVEAAGYLNDRIYIIDASKNQNVWSFEFDLNTRRYHEVPMRKFKGSTKQELLELCDINIKAKDIRIKAFAQVSLHDPSCIIFDESRKPILSENASDDAMSLAKAIAFLLETEYINYVEAVFAWLDASFISSVYVYGSDGELFRLYRNASTNFLWENGNYELLPYPKLPLKP